MDGEVEMGGFSESESEGDLGMFLGRGEGRWAVGGVDSLTGV